MTAALEERFEGSVYPKRSVVTERLSAAENELPGAEWQFYKQSMDERVAGLISSYLDPDGGLARYSQATALYNDDAVTLNALAGDIEAAFARQADVSPQLLAAAVAAARRSVELQTTAAHLDTLAHLLARQGNLDEAIITQRRAWEVATDEERPVIAAFLEELEAKAKEAESIAPAGSAAP